MGPGRSAVDGPATSAGLPAGGWASCWGASSPAATWSGAPWLSTCLWAPRAWQSWWPQARVLAVLSPWGHDTHVFRAGPKRVCARFEIIRDVVTATKEAGEAGEPRTHPHAVPCSRACSCGATQACVCTRRVEVCAVSRSTVLCSGRRLSDLCNYAS